MLLSTVLLSLNKDLESFTESETISKTFVVEDYYNDKDLKNATSQRLSHNKHKDKKYEEKLIGKKEKMVKCTVPDCQLQMKKSYFARHLKRVHDPRPKCSNCGCEFSPTYLRRHSERCHAKEKRSYLCPEEYCNKSFESSSALNKHTWSVHAERVKCPIENCNAIIKKSGTSQHIKFVHESNKGRCHYCGKYFSNNHLTEHMQNCNHAENSYHCTIPGCMRAFKTARKRRSHKKKVHSEIIKCPLSGCQGIFKKSSLRVHINKVHSKEMSECNKCGKQLSRSYLDKHFPMCTGDRNQHFRCKKEGCSQKFRTLKEKIKHTAKIHQKTNSDLSNNTVDTKLNESVEPVNDDSMIVCEIKIENENCILHSRSFDHEYGPLNQIKFDKY